MAVDKQIDSAQLNGALTASANAIRAKTGSSQQINWNLTTGFASAIGAISSGSGMQVGCSSGGITPLRAITGGFTGLIAPELDCGYGGISE